MQLAQVATIRRWVYIVEVLAIPILHHACYLKNGRLLASKTCLQPCLLERECYERMRYRKTLRESCPSCLQELAL
jgi:hypothetical protein